MRFAILFMVLFLVEFVSAAYLSYEKVIVTKTEMPGMQKMFKGKNVPPGLKSMMENQMKEMQKPEVVKHYVHDGKMATINSNGTIAIHDPKNGKMITIDHQSKTYKLSPLGPPQDWASKNNANAKVSISIKGTGKKGKVANQNCEQAISKVSWSGNKGKQSQFSSSSTGKLCIMLKGPKAWTEFSRLSSAFQKKSTNQKNIKMDIEERLLNGFELKSVMSTSLDAQNKGEKSGSPLLNGSKTKITTIVRKLKTKAFDTKIFQIPKGYRKKEH